MSRKHTEPTRGDIENMLKEYNCTTEEELQEKLLADDCFMGTCYGCYKPVDLRKAVFMHDMPFHKYCAE